MMLFDKSLSNKEIIIVAEIGLNHEGSLQKAFELVRLAAEAGADLVKFQSYTPNRYAAANDAARLARLEKFALNEDEHKQLFNLAQSLGVGFLSTPVSEDWIDRLDPFCKAFKIASGDITFKPTIKKAAQKGKPLIISTGAATLDEIDQAVEWVREEIGDALLADRLVLMHCIAAYPAPIDEANLLSIPFLRDRYKLHIGYSNHVIGMEACLTAVALGTSIIEVHFTDQKEGREFRDHALSFDKNDLRAFSQMAARIKSSLGSYNKVIQPCEKDTIDLLRKGVIAARDLTSGTILTNDDLMFARPATEFTSNQVALLLGKTLKQDVRQGYLIPRSSI